MRVRRLGIVTPALPLDEEETDPWRERVLADPQFGIPQPIDLLVGANLLPDLLRPGTLHVGDLIARETAVGWSIYGRAPRPPTIGKNVCLSSLSGPSEESGERQLAEMLQRFWEMEDVPPVKRSSAAHEACEKSFATHRRDGGGKYIVRLPLVGGGREQLGDSEACARAALANLHRRMKRDPRLAAEYRSFMEEYLQLGHMEPVPDDEIRPGDGGAYYIPHHGIWQGSDIGSKLRVVFDASRSSTSGRSLNDVLYPGPKLQTDIWAVILRWRTHRVAFCADIRMMFRQIWIDRRDVDLLRILWSPGQQEPVRCFRLLTVTYGTSCAPYLSLRVLQQLCSDEGGKFPEAVGVALKDRYVDDMLSGAHTIEEARTLRDQLIGLMESGGFPLRKWVSNRPELLADLDESECLRPTWIRFAADGPVRELGIPWNTQEDTLSVGRLAPQVAQHNKRRILSTLASIFDPGGWIAPATLTIKLLLQDLWRARLSWDEELPGPMGRRWESLLEEFATADEVSIPRWILTEPASRNLSIHAFADASRRAMAAVIYARVLAAESEPSVNILIAKTKLAPIRSLRPSTNQLPRMTIPRMELRAALIAARLLHRICDELKVPVRVCNAWSDSQIVLHWIHSTEPTDNSIVDSYVHQIQELTPPRIWRYVPSESNPADVASRGTTMRNLLQSREWFHGPDWLKADAAQWPTDPRVGQAPVFAARTQTVLVNTTDRRRACHLSAFSNLNRLLCFLVRLRRWVRRRTGRTPTLAVLDPLSPAELDSVYEACLRLSQGLVFRKELEYLQRMQQDGKLGHLPEKSPMRALNPFVCSAGVLRVGGRLERSTLPFSQKHPPILDGSSDLAELIISWAHNRSLHGGFRSTYSYALQKAWLIGGKRRIRSHIQHCAVCARARASPLTQLMAPLPTARVTPSRAFARTGVDYAGPFQVLATKGRGARTTKAYVAVFVCMASRAVHLELAGDLTTESFVGALTRFCGRRGRPTEMWSDNATNFHRADIELREALNQESLNWGTVQNHLAMDGISWKFIPPAAPHFGGLWEAAVRSFKSHLKKVVGPKHLTYEEFTTLLVSIEVVLNCRPLGPLSEDTDDLRACTPGHLLVGDSLLTVPEASIDTERLNGLHHWKLVQGLRAKFWQQWSKEYLNTLQQRSKWTRCRENLRPGDLVLVLDPSLLRTNGQWPLGRVTTVHPGNDGLIRTATVKTEHGVYVRPIVKLALLPVAAEPSPEQAAVADPIQASRRAADGIQPYPGKSCPY